MGDKLFAVVRSTLDNGAKACQAVHALREFAAQFPVIENSWYERSNTLVLLETEDLEALEQRAKIAGIEHVRFVEPDWDPNGVLTSLAIGPKGKALVRDLPLAFK